MSDRIDTLYTIIMNMLLENRFKKLTIFVPMTETCECILSYNIKLFGYYELLNYHSSQKKIIELFKAKNVTVRIYPAIEYYHYNRWLRSCDIVYGGYLISCKSRTIKRRFSCFK